jgi:hypothetical protein
VVREMEEERKPNPMEEEREPEPTEDENEWKLEAMGYIIIRRATKDAIENRLQETGDLIIDPTKIEGFFLCARDGKDYQPKEGEIKFSIYANMHFDLLPQCKFCEKYFFVTPSLNGVKWLIDEIIAYIKELGMRRLTSLAEVIEFGDIKLKIVRIAQYYRERGQNIYDVLDQIPITLTIPLKHILDLFVVVAWKIFGEVGVEWLAFAIEADDIRVAGEDEPTKLKKMRILRRILL